MANKFYGSASDVANLVTDFYGGSSDGAQRITKLYGSANGQAKLTHQGFGHLDYSAPPEWGRVYYKVNASDPDSATQWVDLQNASELDNLCKNPLVTPSSWTASVGGITVSNRGANCIVGVTLGRGITSIGHGFLYNCIYLDMPVVIPNSVTSIGAYFLSACQNFNKSISLPSSITTINNDFLAGATAFNQPLDIPSSVTVINDNFLMSCRAFNQPVYLPASLSSIGSFFLGNCDSMTNIVYLGDLAPSIASSSSYTFSTTNSAAACYTQGILLDGTYVSAWRTKFPDSSSSPYRKTVDAGY